MAAEPLARYPVRTPAWVWPVIVVTVLVAIGMEVPVVRALGHMRTGGLEIDALLVGVAALPVLVYWLSDAYRVGAASIDLYADRVEVPRGGRGRLAFALGNLHVQQTRVVQKIAFMGVPTGTRIDRGITVTLRSPSARRRVSDRVFAEPGHLTWLLADLAAATRGAAPLGLDGWQATLDAAAADRIATAAAARDAAARAAPAAVDDYAGRLDEELRAHRSLDD